jgi:hypothetical protein
MAVVPNASRPSGRIGQFITGIQREGGGIEWEFGRKRGLGL